MSLNDEALKYAIAFSMLQGMGPMQKNKLLKYYHTAYSIYQNTTTGAVHWPLDAAEQELNFIRKHGIQCFSIMDAQYPHRLAQTPDAPSLLFLKGSNAFNLPQLISIVGTRQPTYQAAYLIKEVMEGLQFLQLGVISGMALGVDGMAHETALSFQLPTWGVLAHGLDRIYPNQHRKLASKLIANGGLITECTQNTLTLPYQFPKRNRIVAGMSDITIVIESDITGGSMITAKLARGYDREVFAMPGKIKDAKSKGCLWLIKNNIAQLYQDPIDLLENMNWPLPPKANNTINAEKSKAQMTSMLNPIEKKLLKFIQLQGPMHKDAIAFAFGLKHEDLAAYLLNLELVGLIQLEAGNQYQSC